ncbi:hypothetical protein NLU13_8516 [Sarocladium strictum]|uniref:Peptidase A1 domain-containing protein n=1 Tax=Sarocladium strictum TaxID=5046 RepID=A0AA39GBU7_SARSR|nr:hypothetical protein NLU13_8516 [Sarocladium strictum]
MSLKLLQLTATAVALASSVHGHLIQKGQGSAFSVDAITPDDPTQFDPAAEMQRLWAKFPTTGDHGSVKVNPSSNGLSYFVPTVIGNQTFNLIFDTGSADLWVYSNESSPYQSLDHPTYVPTSSAEFLPNYNWSIKYAFGQSVSGVVFRDTVKAGPLTAHKQAVQAATVIPFEFDSDGILGLAFSAINTVQPVKQKTLFETLMPTLKKKLFAANFRGDGKPSTWDFGYIDRSKFKGDITWAPVVGGQKYWSVDVGSYAVGDGSFTGSNETVGQVIIDSGTSLVYLPTQVVKDYYSHIEGYVEQEGGTYTYPCNSSIPDFRFEVADTVLSIPGSTGLCAGAINTQLNMKYSVLGNIFMKNYYIIHSREESTPKVGFASH